MKGWIQLVGGALLFALLVISYDTCNSYKHDYESNLKAISALQDTITYFKTKQGETVAQVANLEGNREDLLFIIGKKDEQLKRALKSGATTAASFSQTAKIDTVLIVKKDTVDNTVLYSSSVHNKWLDLSVKTNGDSLATSVELRDKLSVSFKEVKAGFFKPKKSVVEVANSNPYVKIDGLTSFTIPQKKSNKLKFWIGTGIGLGAGYLIFK